MLRLDNHPQGQGPTVPHVQQPYARAGIEPPQGTTSASLESGRAIAHSDHSATHSHGFKLGVLSLLTLTERGFHSHTIVMLCNYIFNTFNPQGMWIFTLVHHSSRHITTF